MQWEKFRWQTLGHRVSMDGEEEEPASALGTDVDPGYSVFLFLLLPVSGFIFYGETARAVHYLIDLANNLITVDGNEFAVGLLRPTINGVVVPVVGITFGTMLSCVRPGQDPLALSVREGRPPTDLARVYAPSLFAQHHNQRAA